MNEKELHAICNEYQHALELIAGFTDYSLSQSLAIWMLEGGKVDGWEYQYRKAIREYKADVEGVSDG